jgi:hypothetical protein
MSDPITPPATPGPVPAAAPAAATAPASTPPAASPVSAVDGATPTPTPPSPTAPVTSLLSDPPPAPASGSEQAPPPPPAPDEAAIATRRTAITAAITPTDLGTTPDGTPIPWDGAAVDAVASVFARHGVSPDVARDVVAAYADHAKAQFASAATADAEVLRAMVAETHEKLGPNLPRYITEARRGGTDIFGPELFAQLASVPAFANDVRIISALAARGRVLTSDRAPGGAGATPPQAGLAQRMYGGLT